MKLIVLETHEFISVTVQFRKIILNIDFYYGLHYFGDVLRIEGESQKVISNEADVSNYINGTQFQI